MALFVIPVALKAAASFIGANGARAAAKKYGPKIVKEAQAAIAKREASIAAKTQAKKTGKYATDAMIKAGEKAIKADKLDQKALKHALNKKEGAEAFKQLDGRLKFSKGGQPSYKNGEMPSAKPN